ncbi:unnamed protein product [Leptosia nina]|uniref:Uncharacterized protein n=1 Tax=Leptosia nina TaxID=320188 RepID=A0AAV1JEX9_9NEOP
MQREFIAQCPPRINSVVKKGTNRCINLISAKLVSRGGGGAAPPVRGRGGKHLKLLLRSSSIDSAHKPLKQG